MDDKIWLVAEEEERDPLDIVNKEYKRLGIPTYTEGIPRNPAAHWRRIQEDWRRILENG